MNNKSKNNKQHLLPPIQLHHQLQQEQNTPKNAKKKYNTAAMDITQTTNITYCDPYIGITPDHKHSVERELNLIHNIFKC